MIHYMNMMKTRGVIIDMSDVILTNKQNNKIKRAIKALNEVRLEVQQDNVDYDINWYLEDSNNLYLMEGDSHNTDFGTTRNFEAVISLYELTNSSGGGW